MMGVGNKCWLIGKPIAITHVEMIEWRTSGEGVGSQGDQGYMGWGCVGKVDTKGCIGKESELVVEPFIAYGYG